MAKVKSKNQSIVFICVFNFGNRNRFRQPFMQTSPEAVNNFLEKCLRTAGTVVSWCDITVMLNKI